jgi:HD superfamily phosphohydrolase
MRPVTHRDQVHGDVRFDLLAARLLNTAPLQRLGRVYQLGYAHLVYRGGTHTRLSHVMGAYHVAGKLVDLLRQNYTQIKEPPLGAIGPEEFLPKGKTSAGSLDDRWDVLRHLVQWAALLHDIGHVPLGHTLEDEFDDIYIKHDKFESPRMPYLWLETSPGRESEIRAAYRQEDLLPESFRRLGVSGELAWQTTMLICLHREDTSGGARVPFKQLVEAIDDSSVIFGRILKAAMRAANDRLFFPYMADIVGNTICADFLDYLRRDPANVGLDVLRDDRVASRFFIGKDANSLPRMALALVDGRGKPRLDTCTGVVELVRQRFRFAEIIYYHKTKVSASAMLAKTFSLIGKPREVGPEKRVICIGEVNELAQSVISGGREAVGALQESCFPSTLLDPEVGDESLFFLLQNKAWNTLREASEAQNFQLAAKCLRGISLLQGIARRKLYKVALSIDRRVFENLNPGSKQEVEVERKISTVLTTLRKQGSRRTELETKMAEAAGWPDDSLLLYVPPRKSQAKGIETGALDSGDVVTLGTHSAVEKEVSRLNEAYKSLWRILVFVHPDFQNNVLGLSEAIDVFLTALWPALDTTSVVETLKDACWFQYIPSKQRLAATRYEVLSVARPDWQCFAVALDTADGTISSDEHSERAALLSFVASQGGSGEVIRQRFSAPGSLSVEVRELEGRLTVEGRDGASKSELTRAALERIAVGLLSLRKTAEAEQKSRIGRKSGSS